MWRQYNVTTVKVVGDQYKITNLNMIHGWDESMKRKEWAEGEGRFDSSIARARTAFRELAMCNDWQWFVTLTLDPEKLDRYDLGAYHKKLTRFIADQNRRRPPENKITYILIPERHQDGAWHMHGLIGGLQEADLYRNRYGYFGWKQYERSFGFLSVGRIKDRRRVVNYVCKYICKSLAKDVAEASAHLYYRSRGLREPEKIFQGQAEFAGTWDFEHPDGMVRLAYTENLDGLDMQDDQGRRWETDLQERLYIKQEDLGKWLDGYAPVPEE